MVPKTKFRLTQAGIDELNAELADLNQRRKGVADKLKTAREFGDLTENAEYHTAREEQGQLEGRAAEIEHILKNVELIKEPKNTSSVELLNEVVLIGNGKDRTLTIVGSVEADPASNKISDESPIGRALLGKKVGDRVEIKTPSGRTIYTVKAIK